MDPTVLALARRLGLPIEDAMVLDRGTNLIVHLRPAPVVARVTRVAHLVRPVRTLAGAVALASALPGLVTPPTGLVSPGPYVEDGRYVTLWEYSERAAATPAEAGASLRAFHEAARSFRGTLRSFDPRPEAARIADLVGGEAGAVLKAAARGMTVPDLPQQPVHGDAHLGNALAGGVWHDLDEACVGPVEWDIACLQHRWVFRREIEKETREALAAYGDYDKTVADALGTLVVLFTAAWGSLAPLVGETIGSHTQQRLDWLRARWPPDGNR